jgi:hypothetical protein
MLAIKTNNYLISKMAVSVAYQNPKHRVKNMKILTIIAN